jgi:transcriptional regulator with XRE-family HTH domain
MYVNLKLVLWRSGIHQNRMAQDIQMDEAILSRIINGFREPTPEERMQIASYLNAEERWLFTRDPGFMKKRRNSPDGNSPDSL